MTGGRRRPVQVLAGATGVALLAVLSLALLGGHLPDTTDPGTVPAGRPVVGAATGGPTPTEGAPSPEPTLPTLFRVSSFNLLGYGHTAPGGNRRGWADGRTRMRWQVELLTSHDVDVVGFQEFQPEQLEEFRAVTGSAWGVYPGNQLAEAAMHNSIAWRRDTWQLVEADHIAIPYFDGNRIRMPVIRLRNLATGQHVHFANFHNPANARGDAERWRDEATNLEINLVNRLRAATGLPVVITGDMNEKEEYFCRMTRGAPMQAANGGSFGDAGCRPPSPMYVDWVFGSTEMLFSGYLADRSDLVRRTTDHPMIVAGALVPPVVEVNNCKRAPLPC